MRKKPGKFLMFGGVLIFVAMLGVAGYQNYAEKSSDEAVVEMTLAYEEALKDKAAVIRPAEVFDQKETAQNEESAQAEDLAQEEAMPYIEVANQACIGIISIPAINIAVPVNNDCTSAALKKMPCRYVGGVETNSMVIAAHNYQRHFGKISLLKAGDQVTFTDVDGVEYNYEVVQTEVLGAYDVEEMTTGDWDLTLFTCTYGGQNRVTVRCSLVEDYSEVAYR